MSVAGPRQGPPERSITNPNSTARNRKAPKPTTQAESISHLGAFADLCRSQRLYRRAIQMAIARARKISPTTRICQKISSRYPSMKEAYAKNPGLGTPSIETDEETTKRHLIEIEARASEDGKDLTGLSKYHPPPGPEA